MKAPCTRRLRLPDGSDDRRIPIAWHWVFSAFVFASDVTAGCTDYARFDPVDGRLALRQAASELASFGTRVFAARATPYTGFDEFELSNPLSPVALGFTRPGAIDDMVVIDRYLVCVGPAAPPPRAGWLRAYDVSTAGAPASIGEIPLHFDGPRVATDGETVWVVAGQFLYSVAVDGSGVRVLANGVAPGGADIVVINGFVYCGSGGTIAVIDGTDPEAPHTVTSFSPDVGSLRALAAGGSHLYVGGSSGIRAFDLGDPANPEPTGWSFHADVRRLRAHDELHAVCGPYGSIARFTLEDRANPSFIGFFGLPEAADVVQLGEHVVASSSEGLEILDARAEISPSLGEIVLPPAAHEVQEPFVAGDLYYALGPAPSPVYDVSRPGAIREVATLPFGAEHLVVQGTRAYAVDREALLIVNWTDPQTPVVLGHWPIEFGFDEISHVAAIEDVACVLLQGSSSADPVEHVSYLATIDCANPEAPSLLATIQTPGLNASMIRSYAGKIWITDDDGLHVYDVSEPGTPLLIGNAAVRDAMDVAFREDLAVTAGGSGLTFVNVATLSHPIIAGALASARPLWRVSIDGLTAVGAGPGGFLVADFAKPTAPRSVAFVANTKDAIHLAKSAESLLVTWFDRAATESSLVAHLPQCGRGETPILPPGIFGVGALAVMPVVRPNPASGRTAVAGSTMRAGTVTITIYDAAGRHVRKMIQTVGAAGSFRATWDTRDHDGLPVGPGVYFVRVATPDGVGGTRLSVVR